MSESASKSSSRTDWDRVDALPDDEIDTSDVPPLSDAFFRRATWREPMPATAPAGIGHRQVSGGGQAAPNVTRRLQDLLALPREDLGTEIKAWLDLSADEDRADLAQAILALANFGGGYILLGFADGLGRWVPADSRPADLTGYSQDAVNGIVHRYAEPPFHCDVYHVAHPQTSELFPVIRVPGEHRVPIRAKRDGPDRKHVLKDRYYTRRPGPSSEPVQSAREWDDLLNRCVRSRREDLLDDIRRLLYGIGSTPVSPEQRTRETFDLWVSQSKSKWERLVGERLASETPSRYAHGVWTIAYAVMADVPRLSLRRLREILLEVQGRETGWPPWWVPSRSELEPYPSDGAIECWLVQTQFGDAAHSDFWRASPHGMLFLLRGYQEDSASKELEPGTVLDVALPIWRVGESLLHAQRFAAAIGTDGAPILFRVTWGGLHGRRLTEWSSRDALTLGMRYGQARQDAVTVETIVPARSIGGNLPEVVLSLTTPLFELFDFYSPSVERVEVDLTRMRKGSF